MTNQELRNIPVSFYRHKTSVEPQPTFVGNVLDAIRGKFYESQVRTIRMLKTQGKNDEANEIKNNLHAVTFCATFPGRRLSGMYGQYNHLMVIDIDKLEGKEMERVRCCLENNPHVATYWESPSGFGWKGLVPLTYLSRDKNIDVVEMHHWAFIKLEEDFKTRDGIVLDPSGKDITRLCFMSWSPELRLKDEFEVFRVDLSELTARRKSRKKNETSMPVVQSSGEPIQWNFLDGQAQEYRTGTSYDRRLMERIYKFLETRNLSITATYEEWVKVAFAIANTFHSVYGRKMFMKLCELDGAKHNAEKSERLIFDAYSSSEKRCDFSTIIYLSNRKGFVR